MPLTLAASNRVEDNTAPEINERIALEIERRLRYYAENKSEIGARLWELDREWDIERVLQANAAGLSLLGLLLSTRNRLWFGLPIAVAGFLMMHAVQGWCPPIPLLRRLGVRTVREIEAERYGLKSLRGNLSVQESIDEAHARRGGNGAGFGGISSQSQGSSRH
jgi:hypothetical protein